MILFIDVLRADGPNQIHFPIIFKLAIARGIENERQTQKMCRCRDDIREKPHPNSTLCKTTKGTLCRWKHTSCEYCTQSHNESSNRIGSSNSNSTRSQHKHGINSSRATFSRDTNTRENDRKRFVVLWYVYIFMARGASSSSLVQIFTSVVRLHWW